MVPHILLSYLPWNTLQCLHWKCMLEWKAVDMSFLMAKVGLNVLFSINQSVSHHNIMLLLPYVSQLSNVPPQRHLRPSSPRFLCRTTTLYIIARAVERQSAIYTENSWFASPALGRHISTFRGYRILLTLRNPYINRFTNHFSIHS